ncbi:N-acetylmuramoyl-L-alanine amidase [Granulosicoccaceae sp. 1_MG-2023]|nr:N-acetylmuramoyl-L-alanine amidase [Granulosicoccaceae sp. 1_MG-2023]
MPVPPSKTQSSPDTSRPSRRAALLGVAVLAALGAVGATLFTGPTPAGSGAAGTETLSIRETAETITPPVAKLDPPPPAVPEKTGLQLPQFTVLALDPGHGGIDPGALGNKGLSEKVLTLDLAKRVRRKLSDVGNLHVALTRFDDRTININARAAIISNIGADLVLSLHLNTLPQRNITLVESYYKTRRQVSAQSPDGEPVLVAAKEDNVTRSRRFAEEVQSSVFATVKRFNEISVNAGVKSDSMRILSQHDAPGALLEVTCLSNPEEEARLTDSAYLDKLADAVAQGIRSYLAKTYAPDTALAQADAGT